MSLPTCLAVDIGGTKIAAAAFDLTGKIRGDVEIQPVPFKTPGLADPEALANFVAVFSQRAIDRGIQPVGLGLSLCGNVDLLTGEATLTPNLGWRNVPFGALLRQATGLPVAAVTDVRAAALAERLWGVAKGVDYFAWCTVGTGYGGYLFLDGKLYDGWHGFAGPFGHITWDEVNGYPCGCGRKGCVETFVAGPAIARAGQAARDEKRSEILAELSGGGPVRPEHVFQAYRAGDDAAKTILDHVVRLIAINLSGIVNLLDIEMIIMGGGVVGAFPILVEQVDVRIREYLMSAEARRDLRIVRESFPNSALVGAAAEVFVRNQMIELPGAYHAQ
jgi:glucokinase